MLPLLPWLCLSAAAGAMTAWVERTFIGARGRRPSRLARPSASSWRAGPSGSTSESSLWPADLVFIYPRWTVDAHAPLAVPVPCGGRRGPGGPVRRSGGLSRGPLAAALLFAGTLFPALGFINVYPFVFSYVADHFQYLAAAALIPAAAAGLALAADGLDRGAPTARVRAAALCVLAALAGLTWRQCRATTATPRPSTRRSSPAKSGQLARARQPRRRPCAAGEGSRRRPRTTGRRCGSTPTIRRPTTTTATCSPRRACGTRRRRPTPGALRARPSFAAAEKNWGKAMSDAGRLGDAELHFRNALRLQPDYADAHYGLANALANSGRPAGGRRRVRRGPELQPDSPEAHANLGLALAEQGLWAEALPQIAEAVRLRPGYAEAHAYYGYALAGAGRLAGGDRRVPRGAARGAGQSRRPLPDRVDPDEARPPRRGEGRV